MATASVSETPWCRTKITPFAGMKGYGGSNPLHADPGAVVVGQVHSWTQHDCWTWIPVRVISRFDMLSKTMVKDMVVDFASQEGAWFDISKAAALDPVHRNFFNGFIYPEAMKVRSKAVTEAKGRAIEAKKKKKAKTMGLSYTDYLKHLADLQSKKEEAKKVNVVMNLVKSLNLVRTQVDQAINTLADKRFRHKQISGLEQASKDLSQLAYSMRKAKVAVDAPTRKKKKTS